MAERTPIFLIAKYAELRAFLRAYLLFDGVAGPYDGQQITARHLPAAFGVEIVWTASREVYPDQAWLLRGVVTWEVRELTAPVPIAGYRLRFEPPVEPELWQHCGVVLFPSPLQLTLENNGVRSAFTMLAMQRPEVQP